MPGLEAGGSGLDGPTGLEAGRGRHGGGRGLRKPSPQPRSLGMRAPRDAPATAWCPYIPGIGRNSNTSIDAPGDMKCGWFSKRAINASFDSAWRIE